MFRSFTGAACLDDDKNIEGILLDPIQSNRNKDMDSDKYEILDIENSIVEFSDFNFKLAVVQQLMYDKDLLKPIFDQHEFIACYKEKAINPNEYELRLIPEVKEYFEKLPIPTTLLEQVEEIFQDGGNEIYMNVTGFWDGEDEMFNIRSTEDLQFVPNLKSITLFYDEDEGMVEKFEEKGIDSEYL